MDILDQAIEFEFKGHKFFSEAAAKAKNEGVKAILEHLANDELQHAEFLKLLKSGARKEFTPSKNMPKIKTIIEESSLNNESFLSQEANIKEVLQAALDLEKQAHDHYTEEALQALDSETRHLLRMLAKEEEHHHKLIEGLLTYLDNPRDILETPEFQFYEEL